MQIGKNVLYLSPPGALGIPHVAAHVGGTQVVWVPHVQVSQGEVPQLRVISHLNLEELLASTVQLQRAMVQFVHTYTLA